MSFSLGWSPTTEFRANSLQSILSEAQSNNFTFITVPVQVKPCRPLINLSDLVSLKEWQTFLLASSDRSLDDSIDWSNRILFKINLKDENLHLLFDYAAHLTVFAVLIENDDWTVEKIASLLELHKAKSFPFKIYLKCGFFNWTKWSNLMEFLEDSKLKDLIGVVPELRGGDLETETLNEFCFKIWQTEMIKGIILDETVFVRNAKGFHVLPRLIQTYLRTIKDFPIILSTDRTVASDCSAYLKWLLDPERPENRLNEIEKRTKTFVEGFENVLQTPLQPLHDHLPSETYEIFERDPVKYQLYEDAIEAALIDQKEKELSGNNSYFKIGVFGAGRGPLVQAALNAAGKASCRVKILALEKSPNACLTLLDRFKTVPQVEIVFGDMRNSSNCIHEASFDLIVSELLGSFGDNELSPECLWPVESLLKPSGSFIPQSYTSYIEPCYAPVLRTQVKELQGVLEGISFDYGYVVHVTRAFKVCSSPAPIFKFQHPRDQDEIGIKIVNVSFTNPTPQVPVDGLIGYFDCQLYKNVRMSTVPSTASPGMLSWFPIYFPLKNVVKGRSVFEIQFKRLKNSEKVWYEWKTEFDSEFQNLNGSSYSIFI